MNKQKVANRPFGPFPALLAGAMVDGKPNYVMVGAAGCVCLDPVLYVSLKSTHHTTKGIRESGFFSLNVPAADLLPKADYCGLVSGKDVDKSTLFTTFFDAEGSAPMIAECRANFLCRVFQSTEVRGFEMFFGEVVAAYASEDCLTAAGAPDPERIAPLIMAGTSYFSLGKWAGQPFAEGKKLQIP